MEIEGRLKTEMGTVQVSENFTKREFVVTTEDHYPQDIIFQLSKDKCSILDAYSTGDKIRVGFNVRGREWTSPQGEIRYFNTLDAWKIELVEKQNAIRPNNSFEQPKLDPISTPDPSMKPEEDDLPF